jgi:hypothetical protein
MKRSTLLSASILIASAILLSTANANAQNAINQRETQPNSSSHVEHSEAAQPTSATKPSPQPASDNTAANQRAKRESRTHWLLSQLATISAQSVFNFLVMVATIAIATFTYQLVHANRPFLIVEKESLTGYHPNRTALSHEQQANPLNIGLLTAQVTVRNAGSGPAIIDSAVGLLTVSSKPPKPCRFSRYRECHRLFVSERMFAPNEFAELVSSGQDARDLTQEEFESVRDAKLQIVFYGRVRYRSMLRGRFRSDFWYVFAPPHGVFTKPFLLKGPARFNRHT